MLQERPKLKLTLLINDNTAEIWAHPADGFLNGYVIQIVSDLFEKTLSAILVRTFAALVHKGKLHLVAVFEKSPGMIHFGFIIMFVDGWPHFDFFDLDGLLFFPRFACAPFLFVDDLFVIYNFADGRDCVRGNLYQVQLGFLCATQGVGDGDKPDLFTVGANQAYFLCPNVAVYTDVIFNKPFPPLLLRNKSQSQPGIRK